MDYRRSTSAAQGTSRGDDDLRLQRWVIGGCRHATGMTKGTGSIVWVGYSSGKLIEFIFSDLGFAAHQERLSSAVISLTQFLIEVHEGVCFLKMLKVGLPRAQWFVGLQLALGVMVALALTNSWLLLS
ncbi:hypothetical protein QYE76_005836 [Lolium multiflorum]|uniref:Uncharacterized protein n=1 Tax=Lolium multiflorum TaxID=4521 RepID=A0AAD8RTH5_LOLMU|nr:hypothetical protein QYE76_005836 [Lolium multiflorum]